jgi:hypothetical protein
MQRSRSTPTSVVRLSSCGRSEHREPAVHRHRPCDSGLSRTPTTSACPAISQHNTALMRSAYTVMTTPARILSSGSLNAPCSVSAGETRRSRSTRACVRNAASMCDRSLIRGLACCPDGRKCGRTLRHRCVWGNSEWYSILADGIVAIGRRRTLTLDARFRASTDADAQVQAGTPRPVSSTESRPRSSVDRATVS